MILYEQLVGYIHNNDEDTLIIIPVDNLFWEPLKRFNIISESLLNTHGSVETEKTPMTNDEIVERYKEKIDL